MAVTRAQFEAAAKKVMETAPPGLSKEKFLDLVHQQITQGSSTEIPLLQMRSHLNEQETPKEPDTYAGGFIKGLKDYYGPKLGLETGTGNKPGGALRETMESAAMPETLPEMSQSLIPAVPPVLARYASAIREGIEAAPSPLRVPQSVLKVLKDRVGEGARLDLGVRRYLPSKSGVPDGGVPQGEMPTSSAMEVDRYMPSQSGYEGSRSGANSEKVPYASPSEPVNTSPIPSGNIDEMLQELMQKDTPVDSRITGVPPEATTAGEGPLKQSGKFGKSGSLGQPGGYSSGRPSISAEDYAAMGTDTREGEMLNAPLETTPVDAAAATANVEMTPQQRVLEDQRNLAKSGGGLRLGPILPLFLAAVNRQCRMVVAFPPVSPSSVLRKWRR
jgi:hypothetical protein